MQMELSYAWITGSGRDPHGTPGSDGRADHTCGAYRRTRTVDSHWGSYVSRAPSSDRLMISTLQRMYRHFYFRLCDIVDTAELADREASTTKTCGPRRMRPESGKEWQRIWRLCPIT